MIIMWIISVFLVTYGILGLLGIHKVPKKHKGKEYEKEYIKSQSILYLLGGIPWFLACLFFKEIQISIGKMIVIFTVLAVPCFVFSIVTENKYRNIMKG